jgi:low affinity Fe/Cu permease
VTPLSAFGRAAAWTSKQCGRPIIFLLAAGVVVIWALTGPYFNYSDTWQLIINTGTTVITFLMVFLIQNTQNRDTAALQMKLDELIRANENARNALVRLEDLEDEEIAKMRETFDPVIRKGRDR